MKSSRRVRFAEDYCRLSDRITSQSICNPRHPSEPAARTEENNAPHVNDAFVAEAIPDQEETTAEYLMNARLAEQRAKDAMLVARSMQAEIRSHHGRIAKGKVAHQPLEEPATLTNISSKTTTSTTVLDVLKEQEIVTMSMAWITDIFPAQQTAASI